MTEPRSETPAPAREGGERRDRRSEGTHQGKLGEEARRRRTAKNARNRGHRGEAMRPACASSKECTHSKHGRKA